MSKLLDRREKAISLVSRRARLIGEQASVFVLLY
jgi:hypothetical protein